MRKFLITLVLVLFFYLAGLYRSSSVMIFISAFLVFLTILGILSKYLARRLEISVEPERNKVSKGSTLTVALTAANRSRVPVMRFEVRLKIWNRGTSKAEVKKIQGYVPGRGTCKDRGGNFPKRTVEYWKSAQKKTKVWEPLCLFFGQRKTQASCKAVVFPKGYEMQFFYG